MPPSPLLLKDVDYDLKSLMTNSTPVPLPKKEEEKTRDAKRQQQNSW